jgi:Zn-dependent peptidase ImmA (M78 family)/transcriptional regulator with XRE-family HTH domain
MLGTDIRQRRERLGLSIEDVAALADVSDEQVRGAEAADDLPWRVLAALGRALAFDPATLVRGEALGDPRRLAGWFRSHDSDQQRGRVAPKDVRLFARATELARTGGFLLELLGRAPPQLDSLRHPQALGFDPAWQQGYALGARDRALLTPESDLPMRSVSLLLEQHQVHIASVEFESLEKSAVSIYQRGSVPIILLNTRTSRSRSRLSRRSVLAHELCHLLHDGGELDLPANENSTEPWLEALEQRANGYAPAFLAPPEAVIADVAQHGLMNPREICTHIARRWGFTSEGAIWHAKNCQVISAEMAEQLTRDLDWQRTTGQQQQDFEAELPRREPAEYGLDTPISSLADGFIRELVLDAFEQSLISAGRACEVLQFS